MSSIDSSSLSSRSGWRSFGGRGVALLSKNGARAFSPGDVGVSGSTEPVALAPGLRGNGMEETGDSSPIMERESDDGRLRFSVKAFVGVGDAGNAATAASTVPVAAAATTTPAAPVDTTKRTAHGAFD